VEYIFNAIIFWRSVLEQNVFNITLKIDDNKVLKIVNWIC